MVNKPEKWNPVRLNLLSQKFLRFFSVLEREAQNRKKKSLKSFVFESPEPTPISRESFEPEGKFNPKIHSSSFINIRLTRESWKRTLEADQ